MYVLHRIVKIMSEGYIICGDNCINLETDVTDEQIIGKLEGFYWGTTDLNEWASL